MNNLDDIRKRIRLRKRQPLNDDNFKCFYNFMIKFMVALVVVLISLSYVKLTPEGSLKKMILNDQNYQQATSWLQKKVLSFLPHDDVKVNSNVAYQRVKDNYFKNNSNQVLSLEAGRVIETGSDDRLGGYVVVLGKNDVEITYSEIDHVMVGLYDEIEQGMVLGSYREKFVLQFERLGKEISYEEYQRME